MRGYGERGGQRRLAGPPLLGGQHESAHRAASFELATRPRETGQREQVAPLSRVHATTRNIATWSRHRGEASLNRPFTKLSARLARRPEGPPPAMDRPGREPPPCAL